MKYSKIAKKAIRETENSISSGDADALAMGTISQSKKWLKDFVVEDFEHALDEKLSMLFDSDAQ